MKKKTPKVPKCRLTSEQQKAVVQLARFFITESRNSTALIFNHSTGKSRTHREFVNDTMRLLGIDVEFLPPPPERMIKTLKVVDEKGNVLHGKVSKDLEHNTRNNPEQLVGLYYTNGWWRPTSRPDARKGRVVPA